LARSTRTPFEDPESQPERKIVTIVRYGKNI